MLPWGEMMRAALSAGVPPAAFWCLSLREWRWLAGGPQGDSLVHFELEELMTQYPDRMQDNG